MTRWNALARQALSQTLQTPQEPPMTTPEPTETTATVGALLDALQGLPRDTEVLVSDHEYGPDDLSDVDVEAVVDIVVECRRAAIPERTERVRVGRGPLRYSVLVDRMVSDPIYEDRRYPGRAESVTVYTEEVTAPTLAEVSVLAAQFTPPAPATGYRGEDITYRVLEMRPPRMRVTIS